MINETHVEKHSVAYHAGLAERPPTKAPTRPEPRYFEALAWFDSPDDAVEAETALAAAGYAFEKTPYVFDEVDGFLLTPTVYGVITGYTDKPDASALFHQLIEITAAHARPSRRHALCRGARICCRATSATGDSSARP
jgi:hypothetical protein